MTTKNQQNISQDYLSISYKEEFKRKIFHLTLTIILPISYFFLNKQQLLFIITPIAALVVATDHYRHKVSSIELIFKKFFNSFLREHELDKNKWTGATHIAISALITVLFFPKTIVICAFLILAISDCLAALIGKKFISATFFEKSFYGSLTFFISSFFILIICGIIFNQELYYYFFGVLAISTTTIVEARPSLFNIDDNLTIPLTFSCTMGFFALIWNLSY